jgi:hypothetical protein
MPSQIEDYGGTDALVDVYEQRGYLRKKWLDDDGSGFKGYQLPSGQLVGHCFVASPARQAQMDAVNAAETARATQRAAFIQSLVTLGQAAKDGTITAPQQRLLLAKLARVAVGFLED